jgi:DNA topoisomerase VI subunit B
MQLKSALAFPASKHAAQLHRTTFTTSRLLDFCSEKELAAQTGHDSDDWPLVIAKELIDNALDACEEAGIAPVIEIKVDRTGISVSDNGPGLSARTIKAILDFTLRVSSREAYVSPTRGAQGNALKTVLAMPFVLSGGDQGVVEIIAKGKRHRIDFAVDHLRQRPEIGLDVEPADRKNGTAIRVHWPVSACSILAIAKPRFLQIADDYTWLNPHLSLTVDWFGETEIVAATDPAWNKWNPSDPTSPHWYTPERMERLIAAYVAHDAGNGRGRTVREFIAEFRGLSGSAKQQAVGADSRTARATLADLINNNRVDARQCAALLRAMQKHSKPVKPAMLGIISRAHLEARFKAIGCEMETFEYRKIEDHDDNELPFVIETAFGWFGDDRGRRLVTGVNWSPGIINPFRQLGGPGHSLDSILSEQRVGRDEPVILVLHCAYPRVEYLDRGKSAVAVRS